MSSYFQTYAENVLQNASCSLKRAYIYRLGVRGQSSDRTERWLCNSYSPFNEKPQPLLDTSHYIKTETSVTNKIVHYKRDLNP